eukprot:COSAG06_NODE_3363_length_5452_cov_9.301513_8_plen_33_part_01
MTRTKTGRCHGDDTLRVAQPAAMRAGISSEETP